MVDLPLSLDSSFSPTFDLFKPGVCLDHESVIQNFFPNGVLEEYLTASEISRNRNRNAKARALLVNAIHNLESFGPQGQYTEAINQVIQSFREWRRMYVIRPKVLHSHLVDASNEVIRNQNGEVMSASWAATNRFDNNRNIYDLSTALKNYLGPGVFLTLTIDHNSMDLPTAWESIASHWNRFLTRLKHEIVGSKKLNIPKSKRRKSPFNLNNLQYVWVLEAQQNGYPHIHALFLGIDWLFNVGNKEEWLEDGPHSKNLKHFWKIGSVYINKTASGVNIQSPVNYLMKYIRKTFNKQPDSDNKKELTQALLWAFNKRSFNVSRGLFDFLKYDRTSGSNVKVQPSLVQEELSDDLISVFGPTDREASIAAAKNTKIHSHMADYVSEIFAYTRFTYRDDPNVVATIIRESFISFLSEDDQGDILANMTGERSIDFDLSDTMARHELEGMATYTLITSDNAPSSPYVRPVRMIITEEERARLDKLEEELTVYTVDDIQELSIREAEGIISPGERIALNWLIAHNKPDSKIQRDFVSYPFVKKRYDPDNELDQLDRFLDQVERYRHDEDNT